MLWANSLIVAATGVLAHIRKGWRELKAIGAHPVTGISGVWSRRASAMRAVAAFAEVFGSSHFVCCLEIELPGNTRAELTVEASALLKGRESIS
jgi:hypothetical protein